MPKVPRGTAIQQEPATEKAAVSCTSYTQRTGITRKHREVDLKRGWVLSPSVLFMHA